MYQNENIRFYISENTLPNSRTKGRRIFDSKKWKELDVDLENYCATYEIDSDNAVTTYRVRIFSFEGADIQARCTCAFAWKGICKHRVAALHALEHTLAKGGYTTNGSRKTFDPKDTKIKMTHIDEQIITLNSSPNDYAKARSICANRTFTVKTDFEQRATSNITVDNEEYAVSIQKVDDEHFHTSCTCSENHHKLCIHKLILFHQLLSKSGPHAFNLMRDLSLEKNNLLGQYGFSLEDDIQDKFGFKYDNKGALKLILKDDSIQKLTDFNELSELGQTFNGNSLTQIKEIKYTPLKSKGNYGLAYGIFFLNKNHIPNIKIIPITGKLDDNNQNFVSHVHPFVNSQHIRYFPVIGDSDVEIMSTMNDISFEALKGFVKKNCQNTPSYNWQYNSYFDITQFKEEDLHIVNQYVYGILKKLFLLLSDKQTYIINNENQISINKIDKVSINNKSLRLYFKLKEEGLLLILNSYLEIEKEHISLQEITFNNRTITHNDELYLIENEALSQGIAYFSNHPTIKIHKSDKLGFLKNFILPLQRKYTVDLEIDLQTKFKKANPSPQIFLKEWDDFLVLQLIINYEGIQLEPDDRDFIYQEENDVIYKIKRDKLKEADFVKLLRTLHPNFEEQEFKGNFHLSFKEVVQDYWFLDFFDKAKELGIEVFGFKNLSKLKYNTHRPNIRTQVSSGIDWFDVKVKIEFGNQEVSLADVRKAILKNDNFVKLGDGSIGILPEEWINKYATLFKLSQLDDDSLKVSKLHFSLIDNLYEQIEDIEVLNELNFTRERLNNFEIKDIEPSKAVNAELRDYQLSGLKWLNALHELKWGACLADDMGLGKTLQILAFLQHLKETTPKDEWRASMVVSPTTLIFNWENEIQKFCPGLKFYRHHGPTRDRNVDIFRSYDVILTSYGMIVSDVDLFRDYIFNYVILDESQAIKNPFSKRYKAARLLNSNNRIVLTGTPIENNTFDLYAQMNFLNPGLLGNMEFFRSEFSNPIDRKNDKEKIAELRRIVYPFVLRRTKEKVAKELPEKTENILYCEMGTRQRNVYDAFKNEYRHKIIEKIAQVGLKKSGFIILEGLMKLRQICDSPSLLNTDVDYGNDSIKLDLLTEHITQKTNQHKILVFSQFLGMLDRIRTELQRHNIVYEYMDGSTTTNERRNKVERFQEDESCRVFLISLKTGGVGINLTEADYVYLIDPWWNPAVEQQAIDRTHRIGQKKHIFAYRMICKETIEEKIVRLQDKKKGLAKEIISSETSMLKNLSVQDIEELFS